MEHLLRIHSVRLVRRNPGLRRPLRQGSEQSSRSGSCPPRGRPLLSSSHLAYRSGALCFADRLCMVDHDAADRVVGGSGSRFLPGDRQRAGAEYWPRTRAQEGTLRPLDGQDRSRRGWLWALLHRAQQGPSSRRSDSRRPRHFSHGREHLQIFAPRNSGRSEEHTSELQSLMRISYAVFCLKKKNNIKLIRKIKTAINSYTKNLEDANKRNIAIINNIRYTTRITQI